MEIQRFICADCHRTFSVNIGFKKLKHDPKGITLAMQLYFSGESSRKTAESLKLIGMDLSYQTIHDWIQKYISLMDRYLEQIKPKVGDTWRTDELYVKIEGSKTYTFAMIYAELLCSLAGPIERGFFTLLFGDQVCVIVVSCSFPNRSRFGGKIFQSLNEKP